MRTRLLVLSLATVAACATTSIVLNPQPGSDFPADLTVFEYFRKPVITKLAHEFVNNHYRRPCARSVCSQYYSGSFVAMSSVRSAVYSVNAGKGYERIDMVKPAFLVAVRIASAYPNALRWFYVKNADTVIDEMIVYAGQPINHPEGKWLNRKAYEKAEIKLMLNFYADMAEESLPYLRLPFSDHIPAGEIDRSMTFIASEHQAADKIVAECKKENNWDKWDAEGALHQEKAKERERELQTYLRQTSGLPFDDDGFKTWKFAMRRLGNTNPELLKTMIDLTVDAAARARTKAQGLQ